MKKITMEQFLNLINKKSKTIINVRIREYDETTFSVAIQSNADPEIILYLNTPDEDRYDKLFDGIMSICKGKRKYKNIWTSEVQGEDRLYIVIDDNIIIYLNYGLLTGQGWLEKHLGE